MACCRVLAEAYADDVLSDWCKYCAAHRMALGGYPSETAHTITIVSAGHRLRVTIENPNGATADETLNIFLRDHVRRHPHMKITDYPSEEELLAQVIYEGAVGFIIG